MKKFSVLLAMAAMLACVSTATAADNAWFTLGGGDAGATATGGVAGTTLAITASPGETLTIGFNFNASFAPMASWGIALSSAGDTFSSADWTLSQAAGYGQNIGDPITAGPGLDVGGFSAAGTGGVGHVFDFTVTVGAGGDITGSFGTSPMATASGYAWYGAVGANTAGYGYANASWGAAPVVTIALIPEPATLALLGLGAIALIRRRR